MAQLADYRADQDDTGATIMTMVESFLRERAALEAAGRNERAPSRTLRTLALSGVLGLLWAAAFAFRGSHLIT